MAVSKRKRGKDKILDAAEQLFAIRGFDGVTMRQIATKADVDVALSNYHFKNKQGLFDAVFIRRADILNRQRAQHLEQAIADAHGKTLALEAIIDAFLRPIMEAQASHDPGWRAYCSLVALINNSPVWGKQMMTGHFDKLVDKFIDALRQALPKASEKDIYWGYHFLSGALTLTMAETGRIDALSKGIVKSSDVEEAYEKMTQFFANALRDLG